MPRLVALLLILGLLTILPTSASAAGRRRFAGSASSNSLRAPSNYDRPSPTQRGGYEYPKFIGGFHYHDLHNVGIPNGDIGLRGNGISMSPW